MQTTVDVKQLLFSQLSPDASSQIDSKAISKSNNQIVFSSKILSLNKAHAKVLNSILNEEGKVQRAELMFRASKHDFSAKAFHKKCDNHEDTLVLVRTEFGRTIGGYTHYPWTSPDSVEYVIDSGRRAFLFSLDMG